MKTIIIAEDNDIYRVAVTEALEARGYKVVALRSGLGISATVLREKPRLLLLDVRMPGLSGDATAQLVRRLGGESRPRIVLHSSLAGAELERTAKECGADGWIEKDGNLEKHVEAVEAQLTPRRP